MHELLGLVFPYWRSLASIAVLKLGLLAVSGRDALPATHVRVAGSVAVVTGARVGADCDETTVISTLVSLVLTAMALIFRAGTLPALVDEGGRVGKSGVVFHKGLLDERGEPHRIWSWLATPPATRRMCRVNSSAVHTDFMIGGADVDVTGVTRGGRRLPLLMGGRWEL